MQVAVGGIPANGLLSTSPTSLSPETYNGKTSTFSARGGELAISANGNSNGIVWALQSNGDTQPGTLRAYDPTNLQNEYYSSDQAGTSPRADWISITFPAFVVAITRRGILRLFLSQSLALKLDQFGYSDSPEIQKLSESSVAEGESLGCPLNFDELIAIGHDDVEVDERC